MKIESRFKCAVGFLQPGRGGMSLRVMAGILACHLAAGQEANPEVYELSPFEVRAQDMGGYTASEATTGTRYAALVSEIPFPVNVITSELIEDTLALTMDEVVGYTSSFTYTGGTGAFILRGIRNFSHYKNGVRDGGLYAPIAVDRVEVIKGPNAAIFGQTEPTGLRNTVTKRALPHARSDLRIFAGTDDFFRLTADVNIPLSEAVQTRFAGSVEHSRQYVQDFGKFRRQIAYISTSWRMSPKTVVNVNSEFVKLRNHAQGSRNMPWLIRPEIRNGVTINPIIGMAGDPQTPEYLHFRTLNLNGAEGYNDILSLQLDGTMSHRFNKVLSLRVLASHWIRDQDILRLGAVVSGAPVALRANYNVESGIIPGRSEPRLEKNRATQSVLQADLLAHFWTGKLEHKLLLTLDYMENPVVSRWRMSNRSDRFLTFNDFLTSDGQPSGVSPASTFPAAFDFDNHEVWDRLTRSERRKQTTKGVMLSERVAYAGGRVIGYIGGRYDVLGLSVDDQRGTDGPVRYKDQTDLTLQTGLVVKPVDGISLYANYSESFLPQRIDIVHFRTEEKQPLPNITGNGYEVGIKSELLNGDLNFTLGYFGVTRKNDPRQALTETGARILLDDGEGYSVLNDIRSSGVEFDFNWRINRSFSVLGGIGYVDARYTSVVNEHEKYLLGVSPQGTPDWSGGLTASYRFHEGPLRGLRVRLGMRYQGSMLVDTSSRSIYGNSGVFAGTTTVGGEELPEYFFSNRSHLIFDSTINYVFRTGDRNKYAHDLVLHLKNLTGEKYLRRRNPGDDFSAVLSYSLKY